MCLFDISFKGLTTLKEVHFSENITELNCYCNQLTSLEHCPASVTVLHCGYNQLTSLKHCPASVTKLYCSGNQLTSLEHCPVSVTKLDCRNNQLTSLEHCPASITYLDCGYNQLISLEHCPASVTILYFNDNPLNNEYNGLSVIEIHNLNRKKFFQKGLGIVQKMIQNSMAKRIQKKWRWWFYDDLDGEGISRFCRRVVDELNATI